MKKLRAKTPEDEVPLPDDTDVPPEETPPEDEDEEVKTITDPSVTTTVIHGGNIIVRGSEHGG